MVLDGVVLDEDKTLSWCWPPKKGIAFDTEEPQVEGAEGWTPRRVYSWIGVRMWKARIAEQPFFKIEAEMNLVPVIQTIAHIPGRGWDSALTEQEFSVMKETLSLTRAAIVSHEVMTRAWNRALPPTVYAVCDAATTKGIAVLWMDKAGQREHEWRTGYDTVEKRQATHVEARGIAEAVERTEERG